MIKFRCSGCQKAIGVAEKFSGRLIKCPSCQNPTRVPAVEEDASASPPVAAAVVVQAEAAPTQAYVPKSSVHPICPSCQSELFNPSDTLCGICGFPLEQAPLPVSQNESIPVTATAVEATPVGLPLNPAIASHDYSADRPYSYGADSVGESKTTKGRSVGAWFAAVGTGMFIALIWGVIASFTGVVGQVFAVAIGAIVGFIAGLIARNPSMRFCMATTLGALLCMLFGRLVSAWVIMITVSMMSSVESFLIPDTGVSIGVMEDMVNNGELESDVEDVAEVKIESFFSNENLYTLPSYDDVNSEAEVELDHKVRKIVREMSDEEKQAMLEKVRQAHPEWMEHPWHYDAILDSMVVANEIEDEELLAHAIWHLKTLDDDFDQEYYDATTRDEQFSLDEELRDIVMKKFVSMDASQREEAIQNARLNHLAWTPVHHEYIVMLDTMYEAGDIPQELKKIAKSTINRQLNMVFDDSYTDEEMSDAEYEIRHQQETELKKIVNTELLKLEQDEIDKLVAATKEKHPYWQPATEDGELLGGISDGLGDIIDRFDTDGTFWGSLKTRFRTLDFIWLALGTISAFAIAFTLGQSGKTSNLNE